MTAINSVVEVSHIRSLPSPFGHPEYLAQFPRGSKSYMQNTLLRQPLHFDPPPWADVNLLILLRESFDTLDAQWGDYKKAATGALIKAYRRLIRRQSKLESLPSEILLEIFKHMGWRDIVISRGVSRRLFEISKSRPIWLSLLRQCSIMLPRPPTLDRPVDLYATQDLEDLVVSRISAEVAWRSRKIPTLREIPLPNGFGEAAITIVDGGRWLLTLSELQAHYGCVLAYDLDAPAIQEPEFIIRPQGAWDAQRAFFLAVDVDKNQPTLTFNVCMIPEKYRGPGYVFETLLGQEEEVPIPLLQVYRVRQVGHGSQAKLVSRRLKTFSLPMHGETRGISLRGPHFARRFCAPGGHDKIEVYDWTQCGAGTHMKASIFYTYELPTGVSILPGFKLLAICRDHMAVYSIRQLESVPETQRETPILIPDWKMPIESHWLNPPEAIFSKPYVDDKMTRVAITQKKGIYGLIVPTNGDPPRVTMISNERFCGIFSCLGINRFFSQNSMKAWTASYMWPDDEVIGLDGNLRQSLPLQEWRRELGPEYRSPVAMDEETGRVVNSVEDGFVVLDWR